MNRTVHSNDHTPCGYLGVLGCNGYQNTDKVICIRNQLVEDEMMDQMTIKEYTDPFTGSKNSKA